MPVYLGALCPLFFCQQLFHQVSSQLAKKHCAFPFAHCPIPINLDLFRISSFGFRISGSASLTRGRQRVNTPVPSLPTRNEGEGSKQRVKSEGRRSKAERSPNRPRRWVSVFGFRNSAFGFRASDFKARWPRVENTSVVRWLLRPYLRGLAPRRGAGPSDAVFRWSFPFVSNDHRLPSANPPGWPPAVSPAKIVQSPASNRRSDPPLDRSSDPMPVPSGTRWQACLA